MTGLLKNVRWPSLNLTSEERQSIKDLQKDDNILILPVEKGRAAVILDKKEYEDKVVLMISEDKTYEHLSKDPTPKYKRKLIDILKRLKN